MARIRLSTTPITTTPPLGELSIYAKADNHLYLKDSAGNEVQLLDSGGGGAVISVNGYTGVVVLTPADLGLIGANGGLKIPKITTALRETITLEEAELFFDEDEKKYYGGDGLTLGGKELCYCGDVSGFGLLTESGDILTTEDGLIIDIETPSVGGLLLTEADQTLTTENDLTLEI